MAEKHDYSPFDRFNERWPTKGDRIFSPGRHAWPANSIGERSYRLGIGYKLAGDTLVQNFLGQRNDHDNLIYPILFCYRHYIEITLKGIVAEHGPWVTVTPPKKDHNLADLWKLFLQVAAKYYNDPESEAAQAVSSCIDELSQFDRNSVAFRYATEGKSGALIPLEFGSIDLISLRDVMNGISNFLECAELDFNQKRDLAMEAATYFE